MRVLALDLGDRWTGVAISDPLGILARPYDTVHASKLVTFLEDTIDEQRVNVVVVGLPLTLRGTDSDQTKKVREQVEELKDTFSQVEWVLWDERLTSKQAKQINPGTSKEAKMKAHAKAAALILSTYLISRTLS